MVCPSRGASRDAGTHVRSLEHLIEGLEMVVTSKVLLQHRHYEQFETTETENFLLEAPEWSEILTNGALGS